MNTTGSYPRMQPTADGTGTASQAGGLLLSQTVRATGLDAAMRTALSRWRKPGAVHDPAKTCTDVAITLALGGDCLADTALLRAESGLYGPVASDPTVSRTLAALAAEPERALAAIGAARAAARENAWKHAAHHAPPDEDGRVVIDIDATLITAHSEKEKATPTWKKGFGFHPLAAFADHGPTVTGEAAALLRPGNAGSNTADDHIAVAAQSLKQLPRAHRRGRKTLLRTDTAGGTRAFLDWLTRPGRHLSYSVGMTITADIHAAITRIPAAAWSPTYNADGRPSAGAWVCEITGMVDLTAWPKRMRLIVRAERPHPGGAAAHHRCRRQPHHLLRHQHQRRPARRVGLRHRRRARCEDRIRAAKDTGLANLPLHGFDQNRIWLELVLLALDLLAWAQMLALTDHTARRWEPKRMRLRLFSAAARLVATGRRRLLRFNRAWPWADVLTSAIERLRLLSAPPWPLLSCTDETKGPSSGTCGLRRPTRAHRVVVMPRPGYPALLPRQTPRQSMLGF